MTFRGGGRAGRRAGGALAAAFATAALGASAAGAATLEAESVLPPGQSGFVEVTGVLSGTGSPHLSDQLDLFTSFNYKPATFNQPGELEVPRPGVEIKRDSYGVPTITAATEREPRRMYEVEVQGAAAAPDMPFFDRGTWEQSVAMGR